ncbi:MBL fold metallo-hydrolase [Thermoproteus tenax]|uniref:Zn-dependent hydrolase, including glyoxylases n=1 Tax=Thermoproteus tenax (strain ATCC 35583 / DSM 2078 / JCM 9277 / NBRC 100435 / Kra 1) TaxID=768679 RepID=G4RLW4_THETK|nr:MBL fold metallo-hydrolase [Thermoproteus tenax]CCC82559.1 Zn-dependent hydrolase, including glyoxylases [Thermoproteus tenax Kra 1]
MERPQRVGASWLLGSVAVDLSEPLDVKYVVLTHHHYTHTAGLFLSRPRAVIANPFEVGMLTNSVRFTEYIKAVVKRAGAPTVEPAPRPVPGRFYSIAAGWLDLEEASAQVVPCGSHTWGHTCYRFETGIFVGDIGGWIVSVNALRRVMALLRALGDVAVYPSHEPETTAAQYASQLERRLNKLTKAYAECLDEDTPYSMALCARGQGDVLRLAEEGVAFAKYFAEAGLARIVNRGGTYHIKKLA